MQTCSIQKYRHTGIPVAAHLDKGPSVVQVVGHICQHPTIRAHRESDLRACVHVRVCVRACMCVRVRVCSHEQ